MNQPSRRRGPWRAILLVGLAILLLLIGCAAGYSLANLIQPPTQGAFQETCLADKPELRYWTRDSFGVALQLPAKAQASDDAILQAVATRLAQISGAQLRGGQLQPARLIRAGQSAVAFYQLSGNNTASGCDARLISVVNAIDGALSPQVNDAQTSTVLKPLTAQAGSDQIAILGASPDWTFGASGLADGGGGHPGGPPRLLPASFSAQEAMDLAAPGISASGFVSNGAGTTVVVLDTAYAANNSQLPLQQCANAAKLLCIAQGAALPAPFTDLSRVFEESYVDLATDKPASVTSGGAQGINPSGPPAEFLDADGNPVDVVDHGLYISGLIHLAAPGAQIRLARVLNDYGVGSLQGILAGLQTLANHPEELDIPQGSKIVINMSLGFGPPADCLVGVWDHWGDIQRTEDNADQASGNKPAAWPDSTLSCADASGAATRAPYLTGARSLALGGDGAYAALSLPLSLLISDLTNPQGLGGARNIEAIVAAAGNESAGLRQPLDADLPAALCGVIPVAATDTSGARAGFSNSAYLGGASCLSVKLARDSAGNTSSVTIQLATRTGPALKAVGQNTCGLFFQQAPPILIPPSTTPTPAAPTSTAPMHMVLWDGTSFSAGFASGFLARTGLDAIDKARGYPLQVPDEQPCSGGALLQLVR